MKPGDVILVSKNPFLIVAQFGIWSHVALAIDESRVIDATPKKVKIRTLDECVNGAKYQICPRKNPLTQNQIAKLQEVASEYEGKEYSYFGAFFSGASPIFVVIFTLIALISAIASIVIFLKFHEPIIFLPFGLIASLALFVGLPLAYSIKAKLEVNSKLSTIFPMRLISKDLEGHFCSQLVIDIDKKIGGEIYSNAPKGTYLRPKDIAKIVNI